MATERPASDHASHAAARAPTRPVPEAWSLVPSVTTPLYRTTVSQTLRLALRERGKHQDSANHDFGQRPSGRNLAVNPGDPYRELDRQKPTHFVAANWRRTRPCGMPPCPRHGTT